MRVVIKKDYGAAAQWVADHIVDAINAKAKQDGAGQFVLGLPTGGTPIGVYDALIKSMKMGRVSFQNVVTFNMDEYVGLPPEHPQSYHRFMMEHFFRHIDIQRSNVHILNGMASDLVAECDAYEAAIESAGGIDLFFGGLGGDGHIAFNEPGSSMTSTTRVKTLTRQTLLANSRFFDGDVSKVPKQALTVGVGTICSSREVVILATGAAKAQAVSHAVDGAINHMWPVTALQTHREAIIVCDEDAVGQLRYGVVKYFLDIEGDM